jgi:presenilin-like A22 family membrane protease
MSLLADTLSISFIVVLMLLTTTFSMALINEKQRRVFTLLAAIFTAIAVGFMILFIIGGLFFPEPTI